MVKAFDPLEKGWFKYRSLWLENALNFATFVRYTWRIIGLQDDGNILKWLYQPKCIQSFP